MTKGKWYYVEMTWHPENGLQMFVDLAEVARVVAPRMKEPDKEGSKNLYVGRGNGRMERNGAVIMDDLQLWYGDRETLLHFDFIARGKLYFFVINFCIKF